MAEAIGESPIEADFYNNLAAVETESLDTGKGKIKAEDEGSPHALSEVVIAREAAAAMDERMTPAVSKGEGSKHIGRYKNPILAIFATMSVARKTMQDVAKQSKEETRLMKKHWEKVSHEVSDHHNTALESIESTTKWTSFITMFFMALPQLKGFVPTESGAYDTFTQKLDFDFIENFLGKPSDFIKGYAETPKKFKETMDYVTQTGQKMSEPMVNQWSQAAQMANQRDVAVGSQQSDASRVEYQSRQDEKRNEDEGVKNIDQMTQRLMEQEVRAFEVRG